MDNQVVYIVTIYGCNSTPSDMWTPQSKLFVKYEDAYSYFLKVAPPLDNEWNKAEKFINNSYNTEDITNNYIIIENRVHIVRNDLKVLLFQETSLKMRKCVNICENNLKNIKYFVKTT
jgi:hypothetical protein